MLELRNAGVQRTTFRRQLSNWWRNSESNVKFEWCRGSLVVISGALIIIIEDLNSGSGIAILIVSVASIS